MQKRGISTIVATVLVVLITVAGVTALWAGIYPMINQITFNEDINIRLTIDKQGGYTIFDDENGVLRLRIKRASDKADIVALKFVIDIEGNSQAYKRYDVPSINTAKIYYFGLGFIEEVSSVKVVPIYNAGGEEFEGSYYAYLDNIPKTSDALDNLGEKDGLVCTDESYPGQNDGLVLYYDFEEVQDDGDQLFDLSCKGHTGTIQGTPQVIPDTERGMVIEFDGTSGYVDLAEKESLAIQTGGSKTITFWAKPECKGGNSIVFGSYQNYYVSFFDPCGDIGIPLRSKTISFSYLIDSNPIPKFFYLGDIEPSVWHHYAIVLNTDSSKVNIWLYVDGNEIDSSSVSYEHEEVDGDFYFGTNSDGSSPESANMFLGLIDDFRIYNDVLITEEIFSLYEASKK